jgi:septum formation protein
MRRRHRGEAAVDHDDKSLIGESMIYLASRSPRRRELLAQIGVKFEPLLFREGPRQDADTDEAVRPGEQPDDYVRRVTQLKSEAAWQRVVMRRGLQRKPVLAADTTVAIAGEILGKPNDRADAERILKTLSGTQHRVLTAVALQFEGRFEVAVSESLVTFTALDAERISAYVQSGEPFDKAGAYAIQGRAAAFVERLEGSYTGVMGLPLFETSNLLRKFGIQVP